MDEVIERKISFIENHIQYLEQYKEEVGVSPTEMLAIKHAFQESIEASLDIANHIISRDNLGEPDTYRKYISCLHQHGVIELKLKSILQDMASFRNVLVHMYEDVDDEKVLSYVKNRLGIMREYLQSVIRYEN